MGTKAEEQSALEFLKGKLKGYSIKKLLYMELEGYIFWIFKNLPGSLGFLLRNFMLGLLAKSKKGMVWIQPEVNIVNANKWDIGTNVGINSGSYINAVGGITFGDHVLIGSNVTISSGRHPIDGAEPSVYERPVEPLPIVIEDDVWIAAGAVILPGVTLKKGTVVGANSVVTKDTEEYSVVVGAPAKKVKSRI